MVNHKIMSVEEFRQRYPELCAGLSDREVRQIMFPEPDPEKYYFDRIVVDCHFTWTAFGSYMMSSHTHILWHN